MTELQTDFIKYAKENGIDISIEESDTPTTFEDIFGISFLAFDDENGDESMRVRHRENNNKGETHGKETG